MSWYWWYNDETSFQNGAITRLISSILKHRGGKLDERTTIRSQWIPAEVRDKNKNITYENFAVLYPP